MYSTRTRNSFHHCWISILLGQHTAWKFQQNGFEYYWNFYGVVCLRSTHVRGWFHKNERIFLSRYFSCVYVDLHNGSIRWSTCTSSRKMYIGAYHTWNVSLYMHTTGYTVCFGRRWKHSHNRNYQHSQLVLLWETRIKRL